MRCLTILACCVFSVSITASSILPFGKEIRLMSGLEPKEKKKFESWVEKAVQQDVSLIMKDTFLARDKDSTTIAFVPDGSYLSGFNGNSFACSVAFKVENGNVILIPGLENMTFCMPHFGDLLSSIGSKLRRKWSKLNKWIEKARANIKWYIG